MTTMLKKVKNILNMINKETKDIFETFYFDFSYSFYNLWFL